MANNDVIAEYVHWRDTYGAKEFVIMWSDHTWETIRCPFTEYWINNKSYKQHMQLNKVVSSKMSKEKAMKFINKKILRGSVLGLGLLVFCNKEE